MGLKNEDKGALRMADERLIAALDFHDMDEVRALVNKLGDSVNFYKVGMELYYSVGRESVTWLKEKGKKVFLDLKLHDIPNTVGSGLCSLMDLGADMLNVHAEGGYTMMKTAADRLRRAAEEANVPCPKLIAVTVLTSISEDEWAGLGFSENVQIRDIVVHLARLAQKAGLDGVVASPQEAAMIREACGKDFLIVTPGVRPAGSSLDDQSRIATPASALRAGATHLVIGRPIRAAENPVKAAQDIINEMEQVK
jgi:orotidine-5'-phosphate decarboxylase